ncbi:MAG: ATP-binding cassette domain-containing protein [Sphingomonas sp.]
MLLKDSSIASTITIAELTREGQLLAISTFKNGTVYLLIALLYLAASLPLPAWALACARSSGGWPVNDRAHQRRQGLRAARGAARHRLLRRRGRGDLPDRPSGSGKSTILRCINGLETHDGGTIEVDGRLVTPASLPEIRRMLGMVFQRFNLFPHRTALENVIRGRSRC